MSLSFLFLMALLNNRDEIPTRHLVFVYDTKEEL